MLGKAIEVANEIVQKDEAVGSHRERRRVSNHHRVIWPEKK